MWNDQSDCDFFLPSRRWEELIHLCRDAWAPAEPAARLEMAPLGAGAAWNLGYWDEMADYVAVLPDGSEDAQGAGAFPPRVLVSLGFGAGPDGGVHHQPAHQPGMRVAGSGLSDGAFFRAVLCIRRGLYPQVGRGSTLPCQKSKRPERNGVGRA
jgi:FKBP12-rapamycin complex-associated protein